MSKATDLQNDSEDIADKIYLAKIEAATVVERLRDIETEFKIFKARLIQNYYYKPKSKKESE